MSCSWCAGKNWQSHKSRFVAIVWQFQELSSCFDRTLLRLHFTPIFYHAIYVSLSSFAKATPTVTNRWHKKVKHGVRKYKLSSSFRMRPDAPWGKRSNKHIFTTVWIRRKKMFSIFTFVRVYVFNQTLTSESIICNIRPWVYISTHLCLLLFFAKKGQIYFIL